MKKLMRLIALCGICTSVYAGEAVYTMGIAYQPHETLIVGHVYHLSIVANVVPGFGDGYIKVYPADTANILNLDNVSECQINYNGGQFTDNTCIQVTFSPIAPGDTYFSVYGVPTTSFYVYNTAVSKLMHVVSE